MGRPAKQSSIPLPQCPLCGATDTYKRTEDDRLCMDCRHRVTRVRQLQHRMPSNLLTAHARLKDVQWFKARLVKYVQCGYTVPGYLLDLERSLLDYIASSMEPPEIEELLEAARKAKERKQ